MVTGVAQSVKPLCKPPHLLQCGGARAVKGHSTTVSIKVSKTLDYGSIPYAPATKKTGHLRPVFFVIQAIWIEP